MSDTVETQLTVVDVKIDDRLAWVTLNRPEKRNAMSPTLNREMGAVLDELELRDDVGVIGRASCRERVYLCV